MTLKQKNVKKLSPNLTLDEIIEEYDNSQIFIIRLPNLEKHDIQLSSKNVINSKIYKICEVLNTLSTISKSKKTLVFLGPMPILPYIYHSLNDNLNFLNLIGLRLKKVKLSRTFLPNEHFGILIFSTRKHGILNDVKKPYEFCKCCKNTVKDYGGKTHLLQKKGTRISDVWTDIIMDKEELFPTKIIQRIFELIKNSRKNKSVLYPLKLSTIIQWNVKPSKSLPDKICPPIKKLRVNNKKLKKNVLYNTDVFDGLKKIPNNSVNLALIDPPYNLAIKYGKFSDNMNDLKYLEWSKKWIDEIARVLKKNGTLILVNIPIWALELFPYIQQQLNFQGWIVWDAFSYPHGPLISAHYPILCFTKGTRLKSVSNTRINRSNSDYALFHPLNYGYCIRNSCVNGRTLQMKLDRKILTDLWTEIHRIRHNSFRYSHPTLMPQKLAKRLILLFSKPNDLVLDCFNGVGTTTLVAELFNRNYIGIEKNSVYAKTALKRHQNLKSDKDPFTRQKSKSTTVDKGYPKIKPQFRVEKRTLQMEVKKIARKLGHCPSRKELKKFSEFPIQYFYANFRDWAEITVAVRRSGI